MSEIAAYRQKWNRRYAEANQEGLAPPPHALGERWGHRFIGGRALDVASGLGRGIATAGERFDPVYAVDISDVALARARQIWRGAGRVRWILADATRLPWPEDFFGLVCAFGFTDLPFFSQVRSMIAPGGMFLYEGFSARQLQVKPGLDPGWTSTPQGMRALFEGWQVLECEEPGDSEGPPFRLRFAAIRPVPGEGSES